MGILSYDRKFVFIHIPKTGGVSLTKILAPYGQHFELTEGLGKSVVENDPRFFFDKHGLTHIRARDVRDFLGADAWESYFSFSVIRNPWDRLVSAYSYISQNKINERHKIIKHMSFPTFVRCWCNTKPTGNADMLNDSAGNRIVKKIFKLEDLHQDVGEVFSKCGIEQSAELPHLNISERVDYRTYYDDDLSELVRSVHSDEIALGQYEF